MHSRFAQILAQAESALGTEPTHRRAQPRPLSVVPPLPTWFWDELRPSPKSRAGERELPVARAGRRPVTMTPNAQPAETTEAPVNAFAPPRAFTPRQRMALLMFNRLGADDVHEGSSDTEIKAAWRRLAKALHPDHGSTSEDFTLLAEAWAVLNP